MTEDRKEIKDGVKAKVIDMLAEQIAKEDNFAKLKKELADELFGIQQKVKKEITPNIKENNIKRTLDENDGLIPIDLQEEIYKELNGFTYNPIPIEERFENKVDKFGSSMGKMLFSPFDTLEQLPNINNEVESINKKHLFSELTKQLNMVKAEMNGSKIAQDVFENIKIDLRPQEFNPLKEPVSTIVPKKEGPISSGVAMTTIFQPGDKPKKKRKPIRSNFQKSLTKKPSKRKG